MSRPVIGAIAAFGACAALWLVQPSATPATYLLVATVLLTINSAGFVINDYFDIEKDKINEPQRPLPSGRLKPYTAYRSALFLFVAGNIAAAFLPPMAFAVALLNSILLYYYSRILIWNGIIGNFVTAYLSASICLFGASAGGVSTTFVIPSSFVFFLVMLREIIFDLQDQKGDTAVGMKTLATLYGSTCVFRVAWALLCALGVMGIWFSIRQNIWSLLFILACLTLIFMGLWDIQRKGVHNGYARFVSLTRWAMLVMIPAFVMASPRFSWAVEAPINSTEWFFPGAVGYVVVGLAIAFSYTSNQLINEFHSMSRESFDQMDPRWRFYSVYSGLMIVIMVQILTCAWHVSTTDTLFFPAFVDHPHWLRYVALAIGFIPLPVIWLELLYSQHWSNIGFTPYYESNLEKIPYIQKMVHHHAEVRRGGNKFPKAHRSIRFGYSILIFIISWLFYYVVSPLSFVHLLKNWKRTEIDMVGKQYLQICMDLFVILSLIAFYTTLGAMFSNNQFWLTILIWTPFCLTVCVLVIAAAGIMLVKPPDYSVAEYGFNVHFLLGLYAPSLYFDASGGVYWTNWANWVMGGISPLVLTLLLMLLSNGFLRDITEARRRTAGWLREGLTVNFTDRVLHKVSNLLQPPLAALYTAREWLAEDKIGALLASQDRRNEVLRSLDNGLYSIQESLEDIRSLKVTVRENNRPEWHAVTNLLVAINTEIAFASGIRRKPGIASGPQGLELLVNKEQFSAVLQNLVENAADALRNQGHLNPEILVQVNYDPTKQYSCEVLVIDNGPGIGKEYRERIYEPWFSTKSSGSGMGLFIVRQFMMGIGGEVKLESRTLPDTPTMTTFRLCFPAENVRISGFH